MMLRVMLVMLSPFSLRRRHAAAFDALYCRLLIAADAMSALLCYGASVFTILLYADARYVTPLFTL